MAVVVDPMVDLLTQLATLAAANATLQGHVAGMNPAGPAIYARTPAFQGQASLLDFGKKADLSIYHEGRTPMLEGDKRFNVKTETLGPFLNMLHKKATDQGWSDTRKPQQITLFTIMHTAAAIVIDITKEYGRIEVPDLRAQCARFMTGADLQHHANQNNQMMQECIWGSLTLRVQQRITQ